MKKCREDMISMIQGKRQLDFGIVYVCVVFDCMFSYVFVLSIDFVAFVTAWLN